MINFFKRAGRKLALFILKVLSMTGIYRPGGVPVPGYGTTRPRSGFYRPTNETIPQFQGGSILTPGVQNTPYSYAINVIGSVTSWTFSSSIIEPGYIAGLPNGLTFLNGSITGTPTQFGDFSFTVLAGNSAGTASKTFTLHIEAEVILPDPPEMISVTMPQGYQNESYSFIPSATNSPTAWVVSGLPTGLTYNPTTGAVSGIPTSAGTTSIDFTPSNAGGTSVNAPFSLSLVVNAAAGPDPALINTETTPGGYDSDGLVTIAVSPSPSVGNLCVLVLTDVFGYTPIVTDNTGATWTHIGENSPTTGSESSSHIYYRIAGGTITSVTIDAQNADFYYEARYQEWSNIDPTNPVRAQVGGNTTTDNTAITLNASAPETPATGDLYVVVAQAGAGSGNTGISNPSGFTSILNQPDATSSAVHQSSYKILTSNGSAPAVFGVTTSDEFFGVGVVFRKAGGSGSVDPPSDQDEVLTPELIISFMTQQNEVQPSFSYGPPGTFHIRSDGYQIIRGDTMWGQPMDVSGPFPTLKFNPSQGWTNQAVWGVIGHLNPGPSGPVDKLWVAVKNLQCWTWGPSSGWRRITFNENPSTDIYISPQTSSVVSPSAQDNPTNDGKRLRITELGYYSGNSHVWHHYSYDFIQNIPSDATMLLNAYQIRIEGDTPADLEAQFPNINMFAHAGGDLVGGGNNWYEAAHGRWVAPKKYWRWCASLSMNTNNLGYYPVVDSHYNPFRAVNFPPIQPN